jgi:hypothetical protein
MKDSSEVKTVKHMFETNGDCGEYMQHKNRKKEKT